MLPNTEVSFLTDDFRVESRLGLEIGMRVNKEGSEIRVHMEN
jgi:hypothetical protein